MLVARAASERSKTGVSGLDEVLYGGFIPHRLYLLDGNPARAKPRFLCNILLEGVKAGEKCLYITLSETKEELIAGAKSHGWSLDGLRSSN